MYQVDKMLTSRYATEWLSKMLASRYAIKWIRCYQVDMLSSG